MRRRLPALAIYSSYVGILKGKQFFNGAGIGSLYIVV